MMNTNLKSFAIILATVLLSTGSLKAQVLYSDTFSGSNSSALGETSFGGYSWVSSHSKSYIYYYNSGARMAFANEANAPKLSAYVDYDLDGVSNYDVGVDIRVPDTATAAPMVFIAPRTEATSTTNLADISGAFVFQTTKAGTGGVITISVWNGETLTALFNTGLATGATGTGSDAFYSTLFTVRDDSITLVSVGGVSVNATIVVPNLSDNGIADYLLFRNVPSDATAQSMNFRFSNLSVTQVPEPSTYAAVILGLIFLFGKTKQGMGIF